MEEKEMDLNVKVPGFRDGVTKKSILKSLSDADWQRIEQMKTAEELSSQNEYAGKLYVYAYQARANLEQTKRQINESIFGLLNFQNEIDKNTVDLTIGHTDRTDTSGKRMSLKELELLSFQTRNAGERLLSVLRTDLARVYSFVGTRGLNNVVMITESDFNEQVERCISELEKTGFKLL